MLVACVGTGDEPDPIVLLDVSEPAQARVVETLWRRGPGQDVYARWPLFSPATGTCYFVGVEGNRRTLLSIRRGGGPGIRGGRRGHEDELGGLTFSPDGRYLLFGANRPDRGDTGPGQRLDRRRAGGPAAGGGPPGISSSAHEGIGHADAGLPQGSRRGQDHARRR